MNLQKSLDILDIKRDASMDEVRQAYKDLVHVWHPDRLSNNPRLREKAEAKLKEINLAYETVIKYLSSKTDIKAAAGVGEEAESGVKAEVIAEAGTRMVLHAGSFLYKIFKHIIHETAESISKREKEEKK